eukprot:SAG11_NODE_1268_length_5342_cov_1.710853_11_plen_162_part_00
MRRFAARRDARSDGEAATRTGAAAGEPRTRGRTPTVRGGTRPRSGSRAVRPILGPGPRRHFAAELQQHQDVRTSLMEIKALLHAERATVSPLKQSFLCLRTPTDESNPRWCRALATKQCAGAGAMERVDDSCEHPLLNHLRRHAAAGAPPVRLSAAFPPRS